MTNASLNVPRKESHAAGWLCFGLVAVAALILVGIPALVSLLLSFQEYSPARGVFGSPFVGLENYVHVFDPSLFMILVRNSLVQTLLGAFLPLIPALLAGWGASQIRSRSLCFGLAGILLLPAFLPDITYVVFLVRLLPVEWKMQPALFPLLYMVSAGAKTFGLAAFFAAIGGRLALEKGRGSFSGALAGTGLMALAGLMGLFSPDAGLVSQLYNPMVYEAADNFGTYMFRAGMQQMNFSSGAAVWVTGVVLQIIPAVIACILGAVLYKKHLARSEAVAASSGGAGAIGGVFAILAAVMALVVCGFSLGFQQAQEYSGAFFNSLLTAIIATVVGVVFLAVFGYGMTTGFGGAAFLLTAVMILLGQNVIGNYLIVRALQMPNTRFPLVLGQLLQPVLLLGIGFLCAAECGRFPAVGRFFRAALPYLVVFGGLIFAGTWGDAYGETIYLSDSNHWGVSVLARQSILSGEGGAAGNLYTLLTALVPLAVGILCAALLAVLQGKKAEE